MVGRERVERGDTHVHSPGGQIRGFQVPGLTQSSHVFPWLTNNFAGLHLLLVVMVELHDSAHILTRKDPMIHSVPRFRSSPSSRDPPTGAKFRLELPLSRDGRAPKIGMEAHLLRSPQWKRKNTRW
jgi:hypothetical protein